MQPDQRNPLLRFKTTAPWTANTVLLVLVTLGAMKHPAGQLMYLNFFGIIAGAVFFVINLSYSKDLLFAYIFIVVLISNIVFHDVISSGAVSVLSSDDMYFRVVQLFFLIEMAHFLALNEPHYFPRTIILYLLPIIVIEAVVEMWFFPGVFRSQNIPAFLESIPRLRGINGENNYCGALYGFLGLLLMNAGYRAGGILVLSIGLLTLSRGIVIALACAILARLLIGTRVFHLYFWGVVLMALLFPIGLMLFDAAISDALRGELIYISSRRYLHWLTFLNMGLENPLTGVGYFQGPHVYEDYQDQFRYGEYFFSGSQRINEAHNLLLDVWGELGIIGYGCLAIFMMSVSLKVYVWAKDKSDILIFILVAFSLLSGVSEWMFWAGTGVLISYINSNRMRSRRGSGGNWRVA